MSHWLLIWGAVVLTLLPLEVKIFLMDFGLASSRSWNFWGAVSLGVLLLLYWFLPRGTLRHSSLRGLFGATLLLTAVLLFSPYPALSVNEYIRLVGLVWSVPVIVFLTERHGAHRILMLLILIVTLQASWAIWQFSSQADLNLHYLGETSLSIESPGVAKFLELGSETKLLRGYGPYPHPNSLAGSIVIALLALALLWRRESRGLLFILYPLFLGLLVTFSRVGWLAIALAVPLLFMRTSRLRVWWNEFHITVLGIFLVTLLVFSPLLIARVVDPEDQASNERVFGSTAALVMLSDLPWWRGVGLDTYELALTQHLAEADQSVSAWQIAPVHSVPLLLLTEWGVLFGGLALVVIGWWLYRRWRTGWWYLVPLLPLLLFDHYLLTQSAPLFLLLVFLIAGGSLLPKQAQFEAERVE